MFRQRAPLAFLSLILLASLAPTAAAQAPVISITEASIDFGSVRAANGTATHTLTVANLGDAPLTFSATLSGGDTSDFAIPPTTDVVVGASSSATITATFDPTVAGPRRAALEITSNDGANPSVVVTLNGTGTEIAILPQPSRLLDLGEVEVGTRASDVIAVYAPGLRLTVDSMAIVGTSAGDFVFASHGCTGQTCANGFVVNPSPAYESVTVACAPTKRGRLEASVTFTADNDSGDDSVDLLCVGLAPVITPTPANRALVLPPTGDALTATVVNDGDAPLDITSVTITGPDAKRFAITSGIVTDHDVLANGSSSWGVRCVPPVAGSFTATLEVAVAEATIVSPYTFSLTCTSASDVDGGVDGGTGPGDDGGTTPRPRHTGCSATTAGSSTTGGGIALVFAALALVSVRRRGPRGT